MNSLSILMAGKMAGTKEGLMLLSIMIFLLLLFSFIYTILSFIQWMLCNIHKLCEISYMGRFFRKNNSTKFSIIKTIITIFILICLDYMFYYSGISDLTKSLIYDNYVYVLLLYFMLIPLIYFNPGYAM